MFHSTIQLCFIFLHSFYYYMNSASSSGLSPALNIMDIDEKNPVVADVDPKCFICMDAGLFNNLPVWSVQCCRKSVHYHCLSSWWKASKKENVCAHCRGNTGDMKAISQEESGKLRDLQDKIAAVATVVEEKLEPKYPLDDAYFGESVSDVQSNKGRKRAAERIESNRRKLIAKYNDAISGMYRTIAELPSLCRSIAELNHSVRCESLGLE
jgi:hypothetical protein